MEYMMNGVKYYIEDGADLDAFLTIDTMYRWNTILRGTIINTVMPTAAPTYTEPPTAAPTFAPTTFSCMSVVGTASGDGHAMFTLYQGKITLWGGHGQHRTGATMRQPTEAIYHMIATGHWNTIGLKLDGTITTWGHRSTLYNANNAQKDLYSIRCGYNFAGGLTADNQMKLWGTNHNN